MIVSEILSKIREWIKTGIPFNVKSSNVRTLLTWITLRMDVQETGRLKVVKISGNTATEQEVGDRVSGIIENIPVVDGIYLGGNISLLTSYFIADIAGNNPTENIYDDIADMLANQVEQTSGYNQRVLDASPDAVGEAIYFYKGTTNALKSDYIILSEIASTETLTNYQLRSEKGAANGYASLGPDGLVPMSQLPFKEEKLKGTALINKTATGAVAVNFNTYAHAHLVYSANGSITITPPTLAVGETCVRSIKILPVTFTVTLPTEITSKLTSGLVADKENTLTISYTKIDAVNIDRIVTLHVI